MKKSGMLLAVALSVFFLGHLLAAVYTAQKHPVDYLRIDGSEYLELAKSFAETGTFTSTERRYYEAPRSIPRPEAFRTLLLPFLGGVFLRIHHDPMTSTALLQTLILTALAWTLYRIGEKLGGTRGAWFTLGIFTVHPLILLYSVRFCTEPLFLLLLALFVLTWISVDSDWKYPLLGAIGGLSSMTRHTALPLLPAFLIFMLCLRYIPLFREPRVSFRKWTVRYLCCAGMFLLFVLPFGFRNYHYFGTFNLSTYFAGFNLFIGNNRDNLLAYRSASGEEFLNSQNRGWNRALKIADEMPPGISPAEQQKIFHDATRKEIREMGPAAFAELLWNKAWHFIRPWPMYGTHPSVSFWLVTVYELLLYGLGIAGFFPTWKKNGVFRFFY